MLEKFAPQLFTELGLPAASGAAAGSYTLPLEGNIKIMMSGISNGMLLKAAIAPYPTIHEEIFSTQALLGNLFGQGTRGAVLGLSADGATLTLTRLIEYPVDYKEFKEIVEDFVSAIDLWKDETLTHK